MEYRGFTYTPIPKTAWDNLSMLEKSEMMKVAVRNGITDLKTIREQYNEFAEGGSKREEGEVNTDRQYFRTMEKVADENYQKWGFSNPDEALLHALNDNTYDYRGYYNKYPQSQANADTHWTDEFKTAYHPTFSRESIYSGRKSQHNPLGLPGGFWSGDTFVPMAWQLDANEYRKGGSIHISPSKRGTFTAAAKKHGKSVQAFASQVLAHPENYSPAMRRKANFARNASHWKHGEGGSLQGPIVDMAMANNQSDVNLYGWGDWLKKGIDKARGVVKSLGLDKSPSKHFIDAIESNRVHSDSGIGTETLLTMAKMAGIDKITRGKQNDVHYRQNIYNLIDPTNNIPKGIDFLGYAGAIKEAKANNDYEYTRFYSNSAADAAWAKRLGLPYDKTILIDNPDGSVHLSKQLESEIPLDTLEIKKKIKQNIKLSERVRGDKLKDINDAIELDTKALEALRHTYNTGEPVEMNEFQYMSRDLRNNKKNPVSPLNLLHRYTIQYDKENNRMKYWDWYDFNEFEDFVPGSPFKIQGSVDLNKKK